MERKKNPPIYEVKLYYLEEDLLAEDIFTLQDGSKIKGHWVNKYDSLKREDTPGFFFDIKDAFRCIQENWGDMYEAGYYNRAMISAKNEGLYNIGGKKEIYHFKSEPQDNGLYKQEFLMYPFFGKHSSRGTQETLPKDVVDWYNIVQFLKNFLDKKSIQDIRNASIWDIYTDLAQKYLEQEADAEIIKAINEAGSEEAKIQLIFQGEVPELFS